MSSKTFSILSIGQRGVGKTVFLAGSYAELCGDRVLEHPQLNWFECEDQEVQANLERILSHVQETGLYPPATIKVTNFNFNLKRKTLWGIKTLCRFRWWDIPGEICDIRNPQFQEMVLASHGCCVFINAEGLAHDPRYAKIIEDVFNQVVAIASLIQQHRLKYGFAIILTKCDLVEAGSITQLKIEQSLQPLVNRLNELKASYQMFYSAIPIVSMEGATTLNARGAASPLLWLLSELNKHHQFQPQQNLATGLSQSVFMGQVMPAGLQQTVFWLAVVSFSLLGVVVAILVALGIVTLNPARVPAQNLLNPAEQANP